MTIDEYRRGIPTHQDRGKTIGMLCETKERCITDDDGTVLTDKLAGLRQYTDNAYANSNLYTDTKIGELINGAPTTLDTLKEIADAMEENADVVEALDAAVGSKVDQAEYDGHADNATIHITAEERTKWNSNTGGSADTLGGETAEQWQTKIDNIQTTSRATLSTAGWYRVAEYSGSEAQILGNGANSCELILRRYGTSNNSFYHLALASNANGAQEFNVIRSKAASHSLTKVRYTYDATKAYIEVYCVASNAKFDVTVLLGNTADTVWQAITPTLTAETVDGVTVTTTYDIPANASPVSSDDLLNGSYEMGVVGKSGYIAYPDGGSLNLTGSQTGQLRITLPPSWNNTTTNFKVALQNLIDGSIAEYRIGGYLSKSNLNWRYGETYSFGEGSLNNLPVHFANNGTNPVICIGNVDTVWNRTKVQITDVMLGHYDNGYAMWSKGWSVAVVADNSDLTVYSTIENPCQLANYMPLSGGQIDSTSHTPLKVNSTNTANEYSTIAFLKGGVEYGRLGMYGKDTPIFRMADNGSVKQLLHTGNSAKCVVVDTDPGVGASVSYADGTLIFVKE